MTKIYIDNISFEMQLTSTSKVY